MTATGVVEWSREAEGAPLPPFAPGLPIIGNTFELLRDSRPFLLKCYREIGPIFRIRAFYREMTVIAGPQANQFFSQAGADHLRSRELWEDYGKEVGSDNLMGAIDGPSHAWQRKVMKPGFGRETLLARLGLAEDIVRNEVSKLTPGSTVSVLPFLQRVVTEQLGVVLTSRSPHEYVADIRHMVRTALNVLVVRKWPRFLLWFPKYRRARARVQELARLLVQEHRAVSPPARERDMIDDLLDAHLERPNEYTENDLLVGAVGPYVAGLDTVANACTFVVYNLLKNPDCLMRVKNEVSAAMVQGGLSAESLQGMPALQGAIMEAQRLYPVAPMSQRTVTTPFAFGGYRVDAGTFLLIGTSLSHVLPECFPSPERFDIDRYHAPRNEHRMRGAYAPFGLGAHTCLGAGLAGIQMAVVVARLLHHADWELTSGAAPALKQDPTLTFGPAFRVKVRAIHA